MLDTGSVRFSCVWVPWVASLSSLNICDCSRDTMDWSAGGVPKRLVARFLHQESPHISTSLPAFNTRKREPGVLSREGCFILGGQGGGGGGGGEPWLAISNHSSW